MKVQRCKGMRDLPPDEMRTFRFIEGKFRDCCLKWGYDEVRTPALEYLYLFTSAGTLTPGMLGRVYSFLDWDGWSGERVVLRPDLTIPAARYYIEQVKSGLAKLFYVSNVFVFEETGKESREKWQCGAELIGAGSAVADAELITLAMEVLQSIGVKDIELKLSHAGLIKALLAKLGLSPEEQAKLFDQILDGDIEALASIKPGEAERKKTLSLLLKEKGRSSAFLKNISALFGQRLPEVDASLRDFIGLVELLEASGCKCQIDIASGRGFEYYTGVIFHLFKDGEKLGGGGRYDALIPLLGGKETPASGFALYLDSLMKLVSTPAGQNPRILIKADGQAGALKRGFELARKLHQVGYVAEVHPGGKESVNADWVLEIGQTGLTLNQLTAKRRFAARTAEEVLAILEKARAG